jgi:hypothetical protein
MLPYGSTSFLPNISHFVNPKTRRFRRVFKLLYFYPLFDRHLGSELLRSLGFDPSDGSSLGMTASGVLLSAAVTYLPIASEQDQRLCPCSQSLVRRIPYRE